MTIVGEGVESITVCRFCGTPFIGLYKAQYTCARAACIRARKSSYERKRTTDPKRIAESRERNRAWSAANRSCANRNVWLLGQPPHGTHLPGGGCELFVDPAPQWPVEHRNVRALHGALSALAGEGHDHGEPGRGRWPNFAVVPWPRGTIGWGVYWRTPNGCKLANSTIEGVLFDRPSLFRFGPLVRIRAPEITKRGRRKIAIDAVTPVCINPSDRTNDLTRPDAQSLISALSIGFGRRCGLSADIEAGDLRIDIVRDETHVETVKLGHSETAKYGWVRGWVGRVVVECNAPAHWLLACAARGIGLGGRTAFGFGRVRVSEWTGGGNT